MVERVISEREHLWIEDDLLRTWIDAFQAIDIQGDKKPLIELLQKNTKMHPEAASYLADLLGRYNLKKLRGGQRAPSYDYPPALSKLIQAKKYYERYVAKKESKDKAFKLAASICEVKEATLRDYVAGKYASARRVQKRKPRPNPLP